MINSDSQQKGVGLLEALLAVTLLAIVLLAHVQAMIVNHKAYNSNRRNALAYQLAQNLMEQYLAKNLDLLSNSDDYTSSNYLYNGSRFYVNMDVTENSDASVTLAVTTYSVTSSLGGRASLTMIVPLLGQR